MDTVLLEELEKVDEFEQTDVFNMDLLPQKPKEIDINLFFLINSNIQVPSMCIN